MILLLALLLASGGPASRSDVLETRLEARLDTSSDGPGRAIDVRLEVRIDAPGAARLAFHVLEIRETRIENLEAFDGERALALRLDPSRRPLLRGEIELPPAVGVGATTKTERALTLRYRVVQPEGSAFTVPNVLVGDGQQVARVGAFTARLLLAGGEGTDARERFPSNGVTSLEGRSYEWELPLVPAFVAVGEPAGGSEPILAPWLRVSRAGFSFWGLFAVSAAVAGLYLVWMIRCERRSPS